MAKPPADDARQHARERPRAESRGHARSMKSQNDKARAERVVAALTRLRSVYDVGTVKLELETLARGDARRNRRLAIHIGTSYGRLQGICKREAPIV